MSYEILIVFKDPDNTTTLKNKIGKIVGKLDTFDTKSSDVEYLLRWNNDYSLEEDAIVELLRKKLLITVHAEAPKLEKDIEKLIMELKKVSEVRVINDDDQDFWELLRQPT